MDQMPTWQIAELVTCMHTTPAIGNYGAAIPGRRLRRLAHLTKLGGAPFWKPSAVPRLLASTLGRCWKPGRPVAAVRVMLAPSMASVSVLATLPGGVAVPCAKIIEARICPNLSLAGIMCG